MSGIYIPDMEIPKDGYRQLFLTAEGEIIWFPTSPQDGDIRRLVTPVPDHGDLIDKDETMNAILEEPGQDFATFFASMVNEMPAIIPSDKE